MKIGYSQITTTLELAPNDKPVDPALRDAVARFAAAFQEAALRAMIGPAPVVVEPSPHPVGFGIVSIYGGLT